MHVFRGSNKHPNLHPPWKLKYKRHILGMSTSPRNDYCRLRLCRLSCMLIPSTPHKIPLPGAVLWGICKTLRRNSEISHGYMLQDTDSRLLFQTWSKLAREMPCCIGDRKKQNIFFVPFCGTPGEISRKFFYASVHCGPTLIFQVSSKYVQVSGTYNRKTLPRPQKWKQYRLLSAYDNSRFI